MKIQQIITTSTTRTTIIGTIRGLSRVKLYQELRLESLEQWRWFKNLCYLNYCLKCLFINIPTIRRTYSSFQYRLNSMLNIFLKKFLRTTSIQLNNLNKVLRNPDSFAISDGKCFEIHTTIFKQHTQLRQSLEDKVTVFSLIVSLRIN